MGTDHERDFTGDGYAVRRSSEATSERSTRAACAAPLAGGRTGVRYVGNGTAVAGCEATRIRGELRILHPPSSIGEHGCRPSACRQIGKYGISPRALLGRAQRTHHFTDSSPRKPTPFRGGRSGASHVDWNQHHCKSSWVWIRLLHRLKALPARGATAQKQPPLR